MLRKTLLQATRIFFEFGTTRCPQLRYQTRRLSIGRLPSLVFSATLASQVDDESVANSKKIDTVKSTCCGIPKGFNRKAFNIKNYGNFGDDACFSIKVEDNSAFVSAVFDGVGGWVRHGIDPSEFSSTLMRFCYELAKAGKFDPKRPDLLLNDAFRQVIFSSDPRPIGSSTACILIIHDNILYSANLGDSGFLVWRNDEVIYKSKEQVHYFNAPYQLCSPPDMNGRRDFIGDTPEHAQMKAIKVESGDYILLASDGLWDNVPQEMINKLLASIDRDEDDALQNICNSLTLCARQLSLSKDYMSPFSLKAVEEGYKTKGGKPDDITCILIKV
uniref:Protein phosphatase n=1 Tax=Parastrongyloides trichosuri TaxID=131310 RepID=A0A0N4ZV92_PARTI